MKQKQLAAELRDSRGLIDDVVVDILERLDDTRVVTWLASCKFCNWEPDKALLTRVVQDANDTNHFLGILWGVTLALHPKCKTNNVKVREN